MLEKNNTRRVLELFFQQPTTRLHIRGIARQLKISPPTVLKITKQLIKENLITHKKTRVLTELQANLESKEFNHKKRAYNLESIYESGVSTHIINEYNHPTIILFGSYSRGDDLEKSDIDIAIITHKKKVLKLEKYEQILKRSISIHEVNLKKVSKEFKNNLANGIVIEGYLSV